jgi:hypothetical protein
MDTCTLTADRNNNHQFNQNAGKTVLHTTAPEVLQWQHLIERIEESSATTVVRTNLCEDFERIHTICSADIGLSPCDRPHNLNDSSSSSSSSSTVDQPTSACDPDGVPAAATMMPACSTPVTCTFDLNAETPLESRSTTAALADMRSTPLPVSENERTDGRSTFVLQSLADHCASVSRLPSDHHSSSSSSSSSSSHQSEPISLRTSQFERLSERSPSLTSDRTWSVTLPDRLTDSCCSLDLLSLRSNDDGGCNTDSGAGSPTSIVATNRSTDTSSLRCIETDNTTTDHIISTSTITTPIIVTTEKVSSSLSKTVTISSDSSDSDVTLDAMLDHSPDSPEPIRPCSGHASTSGRSLSPVTDEDSSIDDGIHLAGSDSNHSRSASRAYKSNEEFLIAMKEDLADWLNQLYALDLQPDNFIERLDTGVIVCRSVNFFILKVCFIFKSSV